MMCPNCHEDYNMLEYPYVYCGKCNEYLGVLEK